MFKISILPQILFIASQFAHPVIVDPYLTLNVGMFFFSILANFADPGLSIHKL